MPSSWESRICIYARKDVPMWIAHNNNPGTACFFVLYCFGPAVWLVRSQFSSQVLNPGCWQWKHGVLTTELPGNSLALHLLFLSVCGTASLMRFYGRQPFTHVTIQLLEELSTSCGTLLAEDSGSLCLVSPQTLPCTPFALLFCFECFCWSKS